MKTKTTVTKSHIKKLMREAIRYAAYDSVYPTDDEVLCIGDGPCPEWAKMGHLDIGGMVYSFSEEKSGGFSVVLRDDLTGSQKKSCFSES